MDDDPEDHTTPVLSELSQKAVGQPIKNGLISYCPTMDLLAVVTVDDQVQVFRLNGQKVLGVPRKRSCETLAICWKPNGKLLAVGHSDNVVTLIATQGGKTVQQIQCPTPESVRMSALAWSVNFTDMAGVLDRLKELGSGTSLDDVVFRGFLGELSKPNVNLPADLASLDIEGILPKLSVLPPGGKEGEVFTSRLSIDALFHSKDARTSSADALLVGFEDASAYLSIHDFFEVGRIDMKQIMRDTKGYSIVKHCNHPYSSTHGLIIRRSLRGQDDLYFAPLDLKLLSDNGWQFSLLASKATQIQNVLRYVKECQVQIFNEFNASQTLPQRFVANVEEDLQEKEQCSFTTAAYHLVATGDCSPVVREWLVDQVGDRGQKRWEKAAISGYENVRRLIHENLLPALDRLSVLLSRLRGLSLFQETATAFGLVTLELDRASDTLKCLHLLGHSALVAADEELRQSSAFCSWLKHEIDIQNSSSAPGSLDEVDGEPMSDVADLFEYIEGGLQHSKLYEIFDIQQESDARETASLPSEDDEMYEAYKAALRRIKEGLSPRKRLPGMVALVERVQRQCAAVFGGIAETQQKKVRFGDLQLLGTGDVERLDARLVALDNGSTSTSYVAFVAPDRLRAKVTKLEISISKGVSSLKHTREAAISAQRGGKIIDVKFVDDVTLCIAVESPKSWQLMFVPYSGTECALGFGDEEALQLMGEQAQSRFTRHRVESGTAASAPPAKLEVNGRKGRRALCVVSQDQQQLQIFDVDSHHGLEDEAQHSDGGDADGDTVMVA